MEKIKKWFKNEYVKDWKVFDYIFHPRLSVASVINGVIISCTASKPNKNI